MTYTPNVPQATQTIAFTQPLIQGNFSYIDVAMKVDHAWNGNEIASQADGTHQKISLPNQPTDIVGALPTGISAIMYAIGGNLFAWNGAKRPVSGISGTGSLLVTVTPATIFTVPNDCIGFVAATRPVTSQCEVYGFFSVAGVLAIQPIQNTTNNPRIVQSGLDIQIFKIAAGTDYNSTYKFIYWPV